jgi:hypothetical protein
MALTDAARGESHMARAQRVSMMSEVWSFLRVRKKWWLGPVVFVLLTFGALIVFTEGSAMAPFIYTIF